jgi:hypothetical protein
MWTREQVAQLIQETSDGRLHWRPASDDSVRADREGEALTLRRDERQRVTLTTVAGDELAVTVLAESMVPEMNEPLDALWDAAQRVAAPWRDHHADE